MKLQRRWWKVAMTVTVLGATVGVGAAVASAAPDGLPHRPAVTAPQSAAGHAKSAAGSYDVFAGDQNLGLLVLGADQSAQFSLIGDDGVWVSSGTSIAISVQTSSTSDVGCTFSGTVTKKGLNTAKKPGSYFCPGGTITPWYAVTAKP
jgi:hypothetical protein